MSALAEREHGFFHGIQFAQKSLGSMAAFVAHELSELRLSIPVDDTFDSRNMRHRMAQIERHINRAIQQLAEATPRWGRG